MTSRARAQFAPFSAWEIDLALRYLRARRAEGGVALISVIAFVGVLLAVATLIIVMSVMNGFRTELLSRIVGFNGHVYVQGRPIEPDADRRGLIDRLRRLPEVRQVEPLTENQTLAQGPQGQMQGAIVRGVDPKLALAGGLVRDSLSKGALKEFGQGPLGGDRILIGARLAESLGAGPGDAVTLVSPSSVTAFGSLPQQKTYVVAGVFSVGMSEYDQAFIFMPLEQAQAFFGKERVWDVVEVKVKDPDDLKRVKTAIAGAAGPGALVTDWRDRNSSFFTALQVERNVMRLILSLIVAIAAMNIISGLVMLVKNKGRDIAILRTMGATQTAVLRVFFLVGAMIGAAGTFAGLVIGVLFCVFIEPIQAFVEWATGTRVFSADVYFLSRIPARVEWSEVVFVVLWSLAAACLATLPPAFRASRLDPVEALRYE